MPGPSNPLSFARIPHYLPQSQNSHRPDPRVLHAALKLSESLGRLAFFKACRLFSLALDHFSIGTEDYQTSIVDALEYACLLYMTQFANDPECRNTVAYLFLDVDRKVTNHAQYMLMLRMACIKTLLIEEEDRHQSEAMQDEPLPPNPLDEPLQDQLCSPMTPMTIINSSTPDVASTLSESLPTITPLPSAPPSDSQRILISSSSLKPSISGDDLKKENDEQAPGKRRSVRLSAARSSKRITSMLTASDKENMDESE